MHLYVYYDVPRSSLADARARVRTMQAALPIAATRVRFFRRSSDATHCETWMEVYEDVDPTFEAALAEAVSRHGIADLTTDRHVERFVAHGP